MVEYLEGNYVLWRQASFIRTTFDGGTKAKDLELGLLNQNIANGINNTNNMIEMPFPGQFVGIIANIVVNQNNTTPEALTLEFIKTTGGGTTFVETGVKLVVPGANFGVSTGLFYSNTDISEFTRTWDAGEFISLRQTKGLPSSSFGGINPYTVMVLLDLDVTFTPPP